MNKMNRAFTYLGADNSPVKETHLKLFRELANRRTNPEASLDGGLLVLCTPRCGSSLFADSLSQTGLIGMCEEWFNYEYTAAFQKVMGLSQTTIKEYLKFLAQKTVGDTGIFSLKWHAAQVRQTMHDFDIGMESLKFKHIVYLYRRDKIAQAVSMAKASATDQFRFDETPKAEENTFDCADVGKALSTILNHESYYHVHLRKYVHAEYAYEDFQFSREPYDEVLTALGKEPPSEYSTRLKKQRNEHSKIMQEVFTRHITGEYL